MIYMAHIIFYVRPIYIYSMVCVWRAYRCYQLWTTPFSLLPLPKIPPSPKICAKKSSCLQDEGINHHGPVFWFSLRIGRWIFYKALSIFNPYYPPPYHLNKLIQSYQLIYIPNYSIETHILLFNWWAGQLFYNDTPLAILVSSSSLRTDALTVVAGLIILWM